MSEKKKNVAVKQSRGQRFVNWLKNAPRNIARPFKNMASELKKVSWPTRKDLINYSIIVIAFMLFMTVVVGLLDAGASALMQALIRA